MPNNPYCNKVEFNNVTLIDLTNDTVVASNVLYGASLHLGDGSPATGTMANNGNITGMINGLTIASYNIPSGYTSGGTVSLTNDIENALALV